MKVETRTATIKELAFHAAYIAHPGDGCRHVAASKHTNGSVISIAARLFSLTR
jgi:hypothetical protein